MADPKWLSAAEISAIKNGAAVEVEWRDGRTGRYELSLGDGVFYVSPESTRGMIELLGYRRLWLPVNLGKGDSSSSRSGSTPSWPRRTRGARRPAPGPDPGLARR